MTTSEANTIAASKLSKCSTKSLLEMWHHTDTMTIDEAVARTRGWIMDALEIRNPVAFERWMLDDSGSAPDAFFA